MSAVNHTGFVSLLPPARAPTQGSAPADLSSPHVGREKLDETQRMRQRGSPALQTRKIKEKNSEIQAVLLEKGKKTNTNKPSLDAHTHTCQISVLVHLQSKANLFSIGCRYAKADKAPEQQAHQLAARRTHFCLLQQAAALRAASTLLS